MSLDMILEGQGNSRTLMPGRSTRFVLLTSQRTGSTLLVHSLALSQKILCAGEIFHTGRGILHPEFQYAYRWLGSVVLGRLRDTFAGRYRIRKHLRAFYLAADTGVEAVGFKLMVSQLRQFPAIMPTLVELGVRFLYLYRDETFATALSYCRAKATGVFHSDRADEAQEQSIVISEKEFARILGKCTRDKQELIRFHQSHGGFLMRHEEMVANWDAFVEKLGVELGIDQLRIPKALSKLRVGVESARIANEAALLARFGGASRGEVPADR